MPGKGSIKKYSNKEPRLKQYIEMAINTGNMGAPRTGFFRRVARGYLNPRVMYRQNRETIRDFSKSCINNAQAVGQIVQRYKGYYDKLKQDPVIMQATFEVQKYLSNPAIVYQLSQPDGFSKVSLKVASILADQVAAKGYPHDWAVKHPGLVKTITANNIYETIQKVQSPVAQKVLGFITSAFKNNNIKQGYNIAKQIIKR